MLVGRTAEIARRFLETEIPAAVNVAARYGVELRYAEEELKTRLRLVGPGTDSEELLEPYLLVGQFNFYRIWPPIWQFVDPRDGSVIGPPAYPRPTGSSVLHGNGLICAPWSRYAYAEYQGPHADWGPPTKWHTQRPAETVAHTVAEMVDRLIREVSVSNGRMAPLP